jgi:hypothetical protein
VSAISLPLTFSRTGIFSGTVAARVSRFAAPDRAILLISTCFVMSTCLG